jgi:DNA-binding LytR/AlgR family response regulator
MNATALIAEDEPLLAQSLRQELGALWPELVVVDVVADGASALRSALAHRPSIVFLDIRMPGMSGLEAAQAMAEEWPPDGPPCPLMVVITAYEQHAVAAFDHAAVDYVLKPVQTLRLQRTCERLKAALGRARDEEGAEPALIGQLRRLLNSQPMSSVPAQPPLRFLQASHGATLHMVPVEDVIYFEAADKYVRVVTAQAEHVLRMSLRELLPRLPEGLFWQVHRGTLVRAQAIATARREDNGRYRLSLHGCADQLTVSRVYAHLFKGM